jgi:uncharacterized membrane-anchored protein YhcB (DUF1043 family)
MTDMNDHLDSDANLPTAPDNGEVLDNPLAPFDEANLSSEDRRRLADQFWLHALLTQLLSPRETAAQNARIERVLSAIRQSSTVAEKSHPAARRSWAAPLVALAALIVVGVVFFAPQAGPKTAVAAVEQSLQAAAQDVDRQYRLVLTRSDTDAAPPITLTVRGARRFVWEQPVPLGTLRVGSNGEEYWMVPAIGPVIVAAEGSLIERLLSEKQLSNPVLTLTTTLEWLRDRYNLELLDEEELSHPEHATRRISCVHYRGRLRLAVHPWQPDEIEIWSDRDTGVVQRMTLHWLNGGRFGVRNAEIRLQSTPGNLPSNWYDHAGHHGGKRMVIRRPLQSQREPPF